MVGRRKFAHTPLYLQKTPWSWNLSTWGELPSSWGAKAQSVGAGWPPRCVTPEGYLGEVPDCSRQEADTLNILTNKNSIFHRLLEPTLVTLVLGLTVIMWSYSVDDPVLLHLYYVPVVLTGFFLGRYRARLMALLCVITATIIFVPFLADPAGEGVPLITLIVFSLWAFTLFLIAVMVGILSDGWRSSLEELTEAHQKDVLTDPLTGVANRRAYEFELSRRLSEWHRSQVPLSLVLVDIDNFKKFNDRYGHQAGDAVLCAVANELQEAVRNSDLVARYGGEEFGLVLPNCDPDVAREVAERVRSVIEASRFPFNGLTLRLTVSVGVAHAENSEDLEAFVQRADAALYSSKESGRNCSHYHDGDSCQMFGNGMAVEITDHFSTETSATVADTYTDETSGLPSRKVFLEELRRRVAERNRYGTNTTLAIVQFEQQDDDSQQENHAHKSLIATIAKLAASVMRDTDLIARYDANSLAILLPQTSLERGLIPVQRLSDRAANYQDAKYAYLSYSVNIGAVEVLPDEQPGASLHRAEEALWHVLHDPQSSIGIHDGSGCREVPNTVSAS